MSAAVYDTPNTEPTALDRFRDAVARYESETGQRCQLAMLGSKAYAELMADPSIHRAVKTSRDNRFVWVDGVMIERYP